MNSKPSSDEAHRRRVIHQMVSELASIKPDSEGYELKLAVLADYIALPPAREAPPAEIANAPTWRASWLKHKLRVAQAGRALVRVFRQAVSAGRRHAPARRRASLSDRAAPPAAGVGTQDISTPQDAGPKGRFTEGQLGVQPQRRYMLYEPASRTPGPAPLLVLLHGCHQGAEDFAAGTRMNEAAEEAGVVVLYPEQTIAANALRCWNWYALQDRSNKDGDAALIASMTRQVVREHDIDATRVYVAGMSAGGAMAAVLARDYPDLYAAMGVHSGVPAGLAHDVFSALRLMSKGPQETESEVEADADPALVVGNGHGRAVASIVFHGDEDTTVHLSNGEAIHAASGTTQVRTNQTQAALPLGLPQEVATDPGAGQRGFTRSVAFGPGGVTSRELWVVHGAGHEWAGGSETERDTDSSGPDASREMLRFFLQHRLTT